MIIKKKLPRDLGNNLIAPFAFPIPTKVLCRQALLRMLVILGTRKKPEHSSEGFSHLMCAGGTTRDFVKWKDLTQCILDRRHNSIFQVSFKAIAKLLGQWMQDCTVESTLL